MSQRPVASRWDVLLKKAFRIIDHVNRDHEMLPSWSLGGGTAMMLQINHRESHDIDLFPDDPQLLPYVNAAVADLAFDIGMPTYSGDGWGHLKVAFENTGEIDFIAADHMTDKYAESVKLFQRYIQLETIPEIIAKKIRFRGEHLQPRDIFDIAAACDAGYEQQILCVLEENSAYRDAAAARLDKLDDEYITSIINQLSLKPDFEKTAKNAISITYKLLNSM